MLLTDTGNAMRYAQRMRDQVRYSPEIDKWFVWDGTRWALDTRGKALLLTKEIIQDLFDEARNPALSEAQQQNLERWADQTQSVSRRQAMLALAKSEPGISIEAEKLDANPDQLGAQRNHRPSYRHAASFFGGRYEHYVRQCGI
jgi:putative DNA primase/helicase